MRVGLGCRVRSGRAVAVLVGADDGSPSLLDVRLVSLSDAATPESVQPYHAALVDHRLQDMGAAKPLIAIVRRTARRSVTSLLDEYGNRGWRTDRATLVVGSLVDPATIANQHMRAHALEGQLFRTVLSEALTDVDVRCSFLLERTAYDDAADILRRPAVVVRRTIGELGRGRGGPWRADEKLAALGAWTALAAR